MPQSTLFDALLAIAVLVGLARLLAPRASGAITAAFDSREADAAHVVMNGAMLAIGYAMVPASWPLAAVAVLAGTLALRLVLAGARPAGDDPATRRDRMAATGYHLLSAGAMLYAMLAAGHGATPAVPMHEMAAMNHMAAMHDIPAAHHAGERGLVAVVLGLLFLVDGAFTLAAGLFFPGLITSRLARGGGPAPEFSRGKFFLAAYAHLTMDFGMAWMLLA